MFNTPRKLLAALSLFLILATIASWFSLGITAEWKEVKPRVVDSTWFYSNLDYRTEFNITSAGNWASVPLSRLHIYDTSGASSGHDFYTEQFTTTDFDEVRVTWWNAVSTEQQEIQVYRLGYHTAANATIFLKCPKLYSAIDNTFYIYYGKSLPENWVNFCRNFTDFSEVDPDSRIEMADYNLDHLIYQDEDTYSYYTNATNQYNDFELCFYTMMENMSTKLQGYTALFSDVLKDRKDMVDEGDDAFGIRHLKDASSVYKIQLDEITGGGVDTDIWLGGSEGDDLYCSMLKNGTSLTLDMYGDEAQHQNLSNGLSVTLDSDYVFQHMYGSNTRNIPNTRNGDMDVRNYYLRRIPPGQSPFINNWGTEEERPWVMVSDWEEPTVWKYNYTETLLLNHTVFWNKSNYGLHGYIYSDNQSGTWANDTWVDPWAVFPVSGWSNVSKTASAAWKFGVRIFVNDTGNHWNVSSIRVFWPIWSEEKTIHWMFDNWVSREVNSSFPLIKQWNARDHDNATFANQEILSAVLCYNWEQNDTFLDYAEGFAEWLSSQPICYLYQDFNVTLDDFDPDASVHVRDGSSRILTLTQLCYYNSSYLNLLQPAINNFTAIFRNSSTGLFYSRCYVNGTYELFYNTHGVQHHVYVTTALAYAGYMLNNQTMMDFALDTFFAYNISDLYIPYHTNNWKGQGVVGGGSKMDASVGRYIIGGLTLYALTGNSTVYDRCEDVANAALVYQWVDYQNCWRYMVHPDTGAPGQNLTVHGFGTLDEAMIQMYIISENDTYLEHARTNYDTSAIQGNILYNDLICHSVFWDDNQDWYFNVNSSYDSDMLWNTPSFRPSYLFYSLNKTGYYHNSTFIETYEKLYAAQNAFHKWEGGLIAGVDVLDLQLVPLGMGFNYFPRYDQVIPFDIAFRSFARSDIESITINSLTDVYYYFGNPLTGGIFFPEPEYVETKCTTVFSLASSNQLYHTFLQFPSMNLFMALSSFASIIGMFIQGSSINLVWSLNSAMFSSLLRDFSMGLSFQLARSLQVYYMSSVGPGMNLVFALGRTTLAYLTSLVGPSLGLSFALASLSSAIYAKEAAVNLVFSLSRSVIAYFTSRLGPSINLRFALTKTITTFVTSYFYPAIAVVFALSSLSSMIFLQQAGINLVFDLSKSVAISYTSLVGPAMAVVFELASSASSFITFNWYPGMNLVFDLSSIQNLLGVFSLESSINLRFIMNTLLSSMLHMESAINVVFVLSRTVVASFTSFVGPGMVVVFALSKIVQGTFIFNWAPSMGLVFDLTTYERLVGVFFRESSIDLRFIMGTALSSILHTESAINLVFVLSRTVVASFTSIVGPSMAVVFDLASSVSGFIIFNLNPGMQLIFGLSSSSQLLGVFTQMSSLNLRFIMDTAVNQITALWNLSPDINLVLGLSSTTTFIQGIYQQLSSLNLVFSISSLVTFIQHYFSLNPAVDLIFALGRSVVLITPPVMPDWLIELNTLPNWDVFLLLIVALFFTSLFLYYKKVWFGGFSFVSWLFIGFVWLLIQPVSYPVALLFMGIGIIILILTVILQVEAAKMKRRLGEERQTPV